MELEGINEQYFNYVKHYPDLFKLNKSTQNDVKVYYVDYSFQDIGNSKELKIFIEGLNEIVKFDLDRLFGFYYNSRTIENNPLNKKNIKNDLFAELQRDNNADIDILEMPNNEILGISIYRFISKRTLNENITNIFNLREKPFLFEVKECTKKMIYDIRMFNVSKAGIVSINLSYLLNNMANLGISRVFTFFGGFDYGQYCALYK